MLALVLLIAGPATSPVRADEGWVINHLDAQIEILPDGALDITETVLVNFGSLRKHGIYRDIPVVYDYDGAMNRVYDLGVRSVTDVNGRSHQYDTSHEGSFVRIKIGDPNATISGAQSYRIAYRVQRALNAFSDHDELFWNVSGTWLVRIERTTATVKLPGEGVQQVTCYQGASGSREACKFDSTTRTATFETTRQLPEGQQLTIVLAFKRGLVPDPQPKLERKPREVDEFFEATPVTLGGGLLVLVLVLGALGWSWWNFGRDRRFTTMYYLTDDPNEETRPLLSSDPIVVEYTPPEKLRPAQLGLLLDETADTLDVTATIVDLAVRGYLRIAEVPKEGLLAGLLGGKDWELTRTDQDSKDLLAYEKTVLDGLFDDGSPVRISELKNEFYTHLNQAKEDLYKDAMKRKWFAHRPDRARGFWVIVGVLMAMGGLGVALALGASFGAALIVLPIVLGGVLMMGLARWMGKRAALGRELLRRTLGFRLYIATAERNRQQFNEKQNLFAEYLPYAITFRCVDKWARAFQDLDTLPATRSWYTGAGVLNAAAFSHDLQGFSSAVSSTIVSTPGGSGGSGFSGGGGAGGGGGGGGGGSW